MRVSGDFASELVSFRRDGLHLFKRILRRARLVSLAQHSARSANLDDIRTVLYDFANFRARSPRAVGNTLVFKMELVGQEVVVAVPAGDAERRSGDEHARAFDVAVVDAIAHGHVGKAAGAYVTNRGEAGTQSDTRVFHAGHSLTRRRNAE